MDGQEYLNQISANNRPVKKSKMGGLMSSKVMLIGLVCVVALVLIIVIGSLIGGGKKDIKSLSMALLLHIDGTTEVIDTYQNDVKSSDLRGSSSSLRGVLSDTNKKLTDYISQKYQLKPKNAEKSMIATATSHRDELNNELFEAKINGILDRIYAHKMAYEITLIGTEERKILNMTGDSNLKDLLTTSYSSLENLYDSFDNFSEAK